MMTHDPTFLSLKLALRAGAMTATVIRQEAAEHDSPPIVGQGILRCYRVLERAGSPIVYHVCEPVTETIAQLVDTGRPLASPARLVAELLAAVAHLHSLGVVHNNITTRNVGIGADGRVKLWDLRTASRSRGDTVHVPVLQHSDALFKAPEVFTNQTYAVRAAPASDVWAVGCVLLQMCGCSVMQDLSPDVDRLLHAAVSLQGGEPARTDARFLGTAFNARPIPSPLPHFSVDHLMRGCDPELISLARELLRFHPADRISAADALQRPVLASALADPTMYSEPSAELIAAIERLSFQTVHDRVERTLSELPIHLQMQLI